MADLKIFGTLNIVKKYFDIYRINLCIQNQHNCMKNNITQYHFFFFNYLCTFGGRPTSYYI